MKLYEYMVVYHYEDKIRRTCITRDDKIESYKNVEEIDDYLKEIGGVKVTTIDFKLLRTYDSK